jgi:hypothetical protein
MPFCYTPGKKPISPSVYWLRFRKIRNTFFVKTLNPPLCVGNALLLHSRKKTYLSLGVLAALP